METNKDLEQLLLSIQKAFDVLVEKRTDLPIPTIRDDTRSPASLRWRRCADVDHLQDARSQGCEDDAAVCESDPKESASFASTRLRPTEFASYSIAQGLVRASTMFQDTNFHQTLNYSSVSVMLLV